MSDQSSINTATDQVTQELGGKGLDVLINNAGIQSRESGGAIRTEVLNEVLHTNVTSVHMVSSAFLPLLRKGNKKIVNITSTLGSIAMVENFKAAPIPSYKISKSALNMLTVQYSMQLRGEGFTVFAISPGWLKTDLGGAYADLEPETGAKATMDIIYNLTTNDNGSFRNIHVPGNSTYDGTNPPW